MSSAFIIYYLDYSSTTDIDYWICCTRKLDAGGRWLKNDGELTQSIVRSALTTHTSRTTSLNFKQLVAALLDRQLVLTKIMIGL